VRSFLYFCEDLFKDDVSEAITRRSHSRACLSIYNVLDSLADLKTTSGVNESCVDVLSYHLKQTSNTDIDTVEFTVR